LSSLFAKTTRYDILSELKNPYHNYQNICIYLNQSDSLLFLL